MWLLHTHYLSVPPILPALGAPIPPSFPQVVSNKHLSKQEQIWNRGGSFPYASIHHFNEWRCVPDPSMRCR